MSASMPVFVLSASSNCCSGETSTRRSTAGVTRLRTEVRKGSSDLPPRLRSRVVVAEACRSLLGCRCIRFRYRLPAFIRLARFDQVKICYTFDFVNYLDSSGPHRTTQDQFRWPHQTPVALENSVQLR